MTIGSQTIDIGLRSKGVSKSIRATAPAFGDFAANLLASSTNSQDIKLVRIPIILDRPLTYFEEPEVLCVDTPWAQLGSVDGSLTGVVYWNERQFLRDELSISWRTEPHPFPQAEFDRQSDIYTNAITSQTEPDGIPADLLSLFRQSPQSTRGRFADTALQHHRHMTQSLSSDYADHIRELMDHCINQPTDTLSLTNIHDFNKELGGNAYSRRAN